MLPKLLAIPVTSLMGHDEIQANKSVIRVIPDACNASNRLMIKPGNPQALTIRVPINLYISKTWSKSLTTGPVGHDWNLI
jgi:hypothetical protein